MFNSDVQLIVQDQVVGEPNAAIVEAGLLEFNSLVAPMSEIKEIAIYLKNEQNKIIGGGFGRGWGEIYEGQRLWVADEFRKSGLGKRILLAFEQAVLERGGRKIILETYSFQARPFYEKLGYRIVCEIGGMPNGIMKYIMIRDLD